MEFIKGFVLEGSFMIFIEDFGLKRGLQLLEIEGGLVTINEKNFLVIV